MHTGELLLLFKSLDLEQSAVVPMVALKAALCDTSQPGCLSVEEFDQLLSLTHLQHLEKINVMDFMNQMMTIKRWMV
eukprot:NODE_1617_length_925_cov_138.599315_g1130_i0.p2 GENE.NODE_1617_length_925_cov_138.599315_g1130_i0~~NODE_1617_length_925_cov_138.599315_g1130_i0.p2  ORF type:complete len:77 (-),score=33.49 NODE_1617_length_925_cov_138.599315_g1130_i0:268-498(-)